MALPIPAAQNHTGLLRLRRHLVSCYLVKASLNRHTVRSMGVRHRTGRCSCSVPEERVGGGTVLCVVLLSVVDVRLWSRPAASIGDATSGRFVVSRCWPEEACGHGPI